MSIGGTRSGWANNVEQLRQLSGDQSIKRIDFRGLFQFPAVVYVQIALNHSIHHRGQLSMYLRPIGAKVPSIRIPAVSRYPAR